MAFEEDAICDIVAWLKKKYGVLVTAFGAPYPFQRPKFGCVAFTNTKSRRTR